MTHDELIEAAARAMCEKRGWSPDICVAWEDGPNTGSRQCVKVQWENFKEEASWVVGALEPLIRADERAKENEACAMVADEQDVYWNVVAYDRRQCGLDDNFACASAAASSELSAAIRSRMGGE